MSQPTEKTLALLELIHPPEGATTTPHTDDLYAALEPLHDILTKQITRVAEIQRVRLAMNASDAPDYEFFADERVKQTCDALTRELRAGMDALDRAANTAFQLDQVAIEMRASITSREQRQADADRTKAGLVTLSKDEYDHLKARADAGSAALAQVNATKGVTAVPAP